MLCVCQFVSQLAREFCHDPGQALQAAAHFGACTLAIACIPLPLLLTCPVPTARPLARRSAP